jgi:hypothetical protein
MRRISYLCGLTIITISLVLPLFFVHNSKVVYADTSSETTTNNQKLDDKMNKQEQDILDRLKNNPLPSNGQRFDETLKSLQENRAKEQKGTSNINNIKNNITNMFVRLAINARKYSVVIYIALILIDIFVISVFGAKNIKSRKFRFESIIFITLFYIVFLNIPVIAIYFMYNSNFSAKSVVGAIWSLILFAQDNSLVISALILVYGIIQMILSKDSVPKQITGKYYMKMSLVLALCLNIIPPIVQFFI